MSKALGEVLNIGGDQQLNWKVDTFIIPAVEGLNELGFTTSWSCEGHGKTTKYSDSWGIHALPFVDVEPPNHQNLQYLHAVINLCNALTPAESRITTISHAQDTNVALIFGVNRLKKHDKRVRKVSRVNLLSSQLDATRFGLFCRTLANHIVDLPDLNDILNTEKVRKLKSGENPQFVSKKQYISMIYDIQILKPTSKTHDLMNEGMGL